MTTPAPAPRAPADPLAAGSMRVLDANLLTGAYQRQLDFENADPKTDDQVQRIVKDIRDTLMGLYASDSKFKAAHDRHTGGALNLNQQGALGDLLYAYAQTCDVGGAQKTRCFWSGGFDMQSKDNSRNYLFPNQQAGSIKILRNQFVSEEYASLFGGITLESTAGVKWLNECHLFNPDVAKAVWGPGGAAAGPYTVFSIASDRYAEETLRMREKDPNVKILVFSPEMDRRQIYENYERKKLPLGVPTFVYSPNISGVAYNDKPLLTRLGVPATDQETIAKEIEDSKLLSYVGSTSNPLNDEQFFRIDEYVKLDAPARKEMLAKAVMSAKKAHDDALEITSLTRKLSGQYPAPGSADLSRLALGLSVEGKNFQIEEPLDHAAMRDALNIIKPIFGGEASISKRVPRLNSQLPDPFAAPRYTGKAVLGGGMSYGNPSKVQVSQSLVEKITNQPEEKTRERMIGDQVDEREETINRLAEAVARVQARKLDYVTQIGDTSLFEGLPTEARGTRTVAGHQAQEAYTFCKELLEVLKSAKGGLDKFRVELTNRVRDELTNKLTGRVTGNSGPTAPPHPVGQNTAASFHKQPPNPPPRSSGPKPAP